MAGTNLQGFILLLPNEGVIPHIIALRNEIHRSIDSDIKITQHVVEDKETKKKYVHYEESVFKADINFGPIQENEIRKQNLLGLFCNENVLSGIGQSWLHLDTFEINQMIHHSEPTLTSFAFGSIIHMNTFVEHYSSEWSIEDSSCRITQPTVHFKHDIRKLEINFMVTDKVKKRGEKKNLENCELHMLELDYSMILRILIEVVKQPRGKKLGTGIQVVRLYLVMNGAPLIKIRERKDDDDVEDGATAVVEEFKGWPTTSSNNLQKSPYSKVESKADGWVQSNQFTYTSGPDCQDDLNHMNPRVQDMEVNPNLNNNIYELEDSFQDPKGYDNTNKMEDFIPTMQSKKSSTTNSRGRFPSRGRSSGSSKQYFKSPQNGYQDRNAQSSSSSNRGSYYKSSNFKNRSRTHYSYYEESMKQWKKEEREKERSYVPAGVVDDKMVYRRTTFFGKEKTAAHCSKKIIGLCRVLRLDIRSPRDNDDEVWQAVTQLVCCCREAQVYFTSMKQHKLENELPYPSIKNEYYDCVYALKTVTTPSYTIVDEVNLKCNLSSMNQMLNSFAELHSKALEKTLFEIQAIGEKGDIFRFKSALISLFQQNVKYLDRIDSRNSYNTAKSRKSLPSNTVLLRRAILTPTRIVFLPPIVHMKSYLLRNTDPDFALRVTIRDDNFDQLTFTIKGTPKNQTKFLKEFIGSNLLKGFKVGKREYQFFGSSSSQLREHGCLFYAKDDEQNTAETIRKGLGDLNKITNVAKYMARMGQSLSQAMCSVILERKFVEGPVEDVERNGYTFSDGIGKMSMEVAEECYEMLKLEPDDKPCAIQIRYGGCKGMLLLDPTLKGKLIVLRKSMWKFDSDNDSLEILKISRPQAAFLNRPFVTILEQMGIPKQVFFKLQTKQLQQIIQSLYKSDKAVSMLKESIQRLPFQKLHKCGIDLALEPYFRSMIMALYRNSVSVLKSKCRIKLPFSEARTMFGVIDETNTLKYGQVFVQYTNDFENGKLTKEATILEGIILVTKNPCMHPGDVRKFEAVRVPGLIHVRDCIVFPALGPRPHPDEMAGSDLDGDEYCIIWYKDLIFERDNHEAMDYSNNVKATEVNDIQVKHMVDFICDYIRDDCVGLIASAHLAWADSIGIFDPKCMSIAKKYSVTLDFAKSGKPDKLDKKERIHYYPDFMEKFREKDCYLSTKALGYLFRNCKHIETISSILSAEVPVEIDPVLVYEGWKAYEENAIQSLNEYIHLFSTPTRLFHLTNEGEIMAGAIKKLEKSFQGKNIEKNIAKMLETVIPHVMKRMKKEFYLEFANHPIARNMIQGNTKDEQIVVILNNYAFRQFNQAATSMDVGIEYDDLLKKMMQKASAWYKVAYESKREGSTLYLGLPWVVPELMGLLYAENKCRNAPQKPSLELKIHKFLENEKHSMEKVLGEKPSKDPTELSNQIMLKWLRENGKFLMIRNVNIKLLERHLIKQLKVIITDEEDLLNTSTDKLIYKYFTKLAASYATVKFLEPGTSGPAEQYWMEKELGLLAIVALSSLTSMGKLWDSEFKDGSNSPHFLGLSFLTKEFREEIRIPLDLQGSLYRNRTQSSEFKRTMTENTTHVAELLQRQSKVHSLTIAFKETKVGNHWYILLSAYGKTFHIENLKDMIVQPSFPDKLIQAVKDDCCIM